MVARLPAVGRRDCFGTRRPTGIVLPARAALAGRLPPVDRTARRPGSKDSGPGGLWRSGIVGHNFGRRANGRSAGWSVE